MKILPAILIVGFAIIVVLTYITFVGDGSPPTISDNQETLEALETKVGGDDEVTVRVTPLKVGYEHDVWEFEVVLDTHSVELDYDMVETVTLISGTGDSYKPLEWRGDPPSGHHRQGSLLFQAIKPLPSSIEVQMLKNDADKWTFDWEL